MSSRSTFGQRLRGWRRTRDLTQTELATLVGYAVSSIRKLESGVLRPSYQLAQRLADVLELSERERTTFLQLARALPGPNEHAHRATTGETPTHGQGAVEPSTSHLVPLIGRAGEIEDAAQTLLQPYVRLLTLTGPGGVGKTRLASAIATAVRPHFADGVFVVSLGDVHNFELVGSAIVRALGLQPFNARSPEDQLLVLLKDQQLLLVLDTFEHIVDAAPLVTRLLSASPGLKVLVTSRVTLGMPIEHVRQVPPLTNPPIDAIPTITTLQAYPATTLFLRHVWAIRPDLEMTSEHNAIVLTICRLLDGLPLALELAAAQGQRFTLRDLLAHLQPHVLTLHDEQHSGPGRHTTLSATIDWSYRLLDPITQSVFARLAVFGGGWTGDAAQAICDHEADLPDPVVDRLTTLLDHNLIMLQRSSNSIPRYTMLDTVREYAHERFVEHPEREPIQQKHISYFVSLAETAATHYRRTDETMWLDRLELENANLRLAMERSRSAGLSDVVLHLVGLLGHFWVRRGYWHEGLQALNMSMEPSGAAPSLERLEALGSGILIATRLDDFQSMEKWAREELRLSHLLDNQRAAAHAHAYLGCVAHVTDDNDNAAEQHLATSLALYQNSDDAHGVALIRYHQWRMAAHRGEATKGRQWLEESIVLDRQTGDQVGLAQSLNDLGAVLAEVEGQYAEARVLTEEGLAYFRAAHDVWGTCYALRNLGEILVAQGELADAQVLFEESLATALRYQHINGAATCYFELGILAWIKGDLALARTHFETNLRLAKETNNPWGMAEALLGLGHVAYRLSDRSAARENYTGCIRCFRQRQLVVHMRIPLLGVAWANALDHPGWSARALGAVEEALESPDARMAWYASDRVVVQEIRDGLNATIIDSVLLSARKEGRATPFMQIIDEVIRGEPLTARVR